MDLHAQKAKDRKSEEFVARAARLSELIPRSRSRRHEDFYDLVRIGLVRLESHIDDVNPAVFSLLLRVTENLQAVPYVPPCTLM